MSSDEAGSEINKQQNNHAAEEGDNNNSQYSTVKSNENFGTDYSFKREIVWKNVFGFIVLHVCATYGLVLCFTRAKLATSIYMVVMMVLTGQGVTAGAHRLWCHRSYKVRTPLKILLLIFQTASGQNCLWVWVRDHRQHHRYSDTDADPHNANRGFFFSHMGWLMCKKHPLVIEMGRTIDMSDLEEDPMVMFQKRYYNILYFIFAFLLPVYIPVFLWNEEVWTSLFVSYFARYVYQLHGTWTVNSLAHYTGFKPYDKDIVPVDSKVVAFLAIGEGWHNFHHTFPWDYRTGEWGGIYNISTCWIDCMHALGQAYDLKTASNSIIMKKMAKSGDGTKYRNVHEKMF